MRLIYRRRICERQRVTVKDRYEQKKQLFFNPFCPGVSEHDHHPLLVSEQGCSMFIGHGCRKSESEKRDRNFIQKHSRLCPRSNYLFHIIISYYIVYKMGDYFLKKRKYVHMQCIFPPDENQTSIFPTVGKEQVGKLLHTIYINI